MEITRKNFTHLMQYTGAMASQRHTVTVVIRCINSRECTKYTNTCYDRISRQKGHSLSFPSLSNTQSSAQSSCSHRPQAHSTHSLPDWSRISSSYVVKHTTFTIINVTTWCIACIRAAFGGGCISLLVFKELTPGLAFRFIPILAFLVLSAAFRDFSSALRAFSSAFQAFSSSLSFVFLAFSEKY